MNLTHNQEILFTRQRHEAERAGLHYDYRIVVGDKAYSWATKKDLPAPGKSILLYEQPVHTASYAISKKVIIPKGQYGAGITTLDWVSKGKVHNPEEDKEKFIVELKDKQRFLIKKLDEKYGKKAWLFKNLTSDNNKYLDKVAQYLKEPARPENLGIDLGSGKEEELHKWMIAVTLFSRPVQRNIATRAAKQLFSEGVTSPQAVEEKGWKGLVEALGRGHYVRFDESMSNTLLSQAKQLQEKYGTISNMIRSKTPVEIEEEIKSFRGIGPLGGKLFTEGLTPYLHLYNK